ncbi:MAG: VTT domain-containing protein [Thiohalomonadaceae bacterium]
MTPTPILDPGRNCWRIEQADRLAFLVDGAAYFSAVRNALLQARRAVYILGWDIDSRLRLTRSGEQDGYPEPLGEFLNELVRRRRDLSIYILVWDFAMIYALDREWRPIYKPTWQRHPRLHFRMDGRHPAGASQHQKIVAIDDSAAFLGGMDLSKWRWDTPEHRPLDPRRSGPEGHLYPPYHDVQVLVSGAAARALAELARERWWRATGECLAVPARNGSVWPEGLDADMRHVDLGIARTFPRYNGWDEVREVERLHGDAIRAARQYIYIENQYFTSNHVKNLLAERLADEHGPEIVLVLPKRSDGWLEQHTMDVLRARVLEGLHAADRHHRLAVYYPDHPLVSPNYINVHDKVMVVDDELLRIGSANLSNRSMGLDSECDLVLEARGDPLARAQVASFRNRLLAEHLETTPGTVAETLEREGSLLRTIAALRRPGRTLMPLETRLTSMEDWASDLTLVDPEHPMEAEALVQHFVDEEQRGPARRHLMRNIILLTALFLLAAAWRFTPLRDYLQVETLLALIQALRELPAAPLLTIAGFVLGGLISVPVTLLVVVTVLAFGPWAGFGYALTGSILSACATYAAGNWLGRDLVRRFAGARVNRLSQRLAERGVLAMAVIRFLPIAPFTVVNMVAGASHIRFRDFALGTLLGMAPGMLAITVFVDRIAASLKSPEPVNLVVLAGVVFVIVVAAFLLRRLLRRVPHHQGTGSDAGP